MRFSSVLKKFFITALFRPFPLCGIFCATPWGFNFAYSLQFDIANLIHMQRRGILWPGTVNASYSIVLTMLHHRPFWQAVGDNFPVKQIGELATGTTFPLYRELCNIRSHFSLAFVKVPAQDIGRRSLIWWTPLCRMLQIMTRWISLDAYDYMHHIVNDYATECMTHIKALGSGLITMSC